MDKIMRIIKLKILTLSLMLSACIPMPHTEYFAPRITGVVQKDNIPLRQTGIYLNAINDKCEGREELSTAAKTNGNGEFEIGPVMTKRLAVWLMGDPVTLWTMCIEINGQREVILNQRGFGYPVENIRVICDLSWDDELLIIETPKMKGKCKLISPQQENRGDR
jgi:hypothetical protein